MSMGYPCWPWCQQVYSYQKNTHKSKERGRKFSFRPLLYSMHHVVERVIAVFYESTSYSCHAIETFELTWYVTYCGSDAHEQRVSQNFLCCHNFFIFNDNTFCFWSQCKVMSVGDGFQQMHAFLHKQYATRIVFCDKTANGCQNCHNTHDKRSTRFMRIAKLSTHNAYLWHRGHIIYRFSTFSG